MFSLHGLAEMLYSQTLDEIPEQENDCIILDDVSQEKAPNGTGKKKRKTPSKKTVVSDDSDDCMIVSDKEQEVLTISDEESTPENCNKKRKTDDSNSDKTSDVIVIGKDSIAQHDPSSERNKLPDDSDPVTSSEVSSAQKISSPSVERSTSDILTEQRSACQDADSENPVSDGSVSQTGAKESEDSNEVGTSRKDSNLDLERVEESSSISLGPKSVKEVRISEDIRESEHSASASENPVSDGNVSQSKHDDGKSGSNENAQKESNTKELEASKDQEKSPVTEENSISLVSNKIASDQITVEKETSSQVTTDSDKEASKSSEISTELKTSLNEHSSEKQDNAEANPVVYSDSVLIESSDEDSNDCTIITKETSENIDDTSKATNKNIETDKVDNSKAMHTEPHQSVPDTVQDSDDNIIISDSVPANPEETTNEKANDVELSLEKNMECRETKESDDKTKENLSELDLERENSEVKPTEKAQEVLAEKASDILKADSEMESENTESTLVVDKGDSQVSIKNLKTVDDEKEKESSQVDVISIASENNSKSVKDKQIVSAENSDYNETSNKKATLSKEESTECRKAKDSDVKSSENLSENEISQTDVKSVDSENNSESVKSKQTIPAENSDSIETINKKANVVELSKEKPLECRKAKDSDGKSEENLSELNTESGSNTITENNYSKPYNEVTESDKLSKELVPESTIESVTHKQVISVENSDCNKKDVGESSKYEMTRCKETKNNDGESEDNSSESKIESEISDKSDNNVAQAEQIFENLVTESDIVLEGNITYKKSGNDTVADSIEAENSDSEKTKLMKEVSTLEDRTDTDILLKEQGVSIETHCVRNETPETSDLINKSEIVDSPKKHVQNIDNVEINKSQKVDANIILEDNADNQYESNTS